MSLVVLDPACVDDEVLVGDGQAFVGGEKEDQFCDFFRLDFALDCLAAHDLLLVLFRVDELALFLGHDCSRHHAVHADAVDADFMTRSRLRSTAAKKMSFSVRMLIASDWGPFGKFG